MALFHLLHFLLQSTLQGRLSPPKTLEQVPPSLESLSILTKKFFARPLGGCPLVYASALR